MKSIPERDCDETSLSAYAVGELDGDASSQIERHLARCKQCRAIHRQLADLPPLLALHISPDEAAQVDRSFARALAEARLHRSARLSHASQGAAAAPFAPDVLPPPSLSSRSSPGTLWGVASSILQLGRRPRFALGAGLACGLLVVAVLVPRLSHLLSDRSDPANLPELEAPRVVSKGFSSEDTLPLNLSFSVQNSRGMLARGRDNGRYLHSDALYFQVDVPSEGYLLLVRSCGDEIEPLMPAGYGWSALPVQSGSWQLAEGSQLLALPLRDLQGPQQFVALLSPEPFVLSPAQQELLRTAAGLTRLAQAASLRIGAVQIRVEDAPGPTVPSEMRPGSDPVP